METIADKRTSAFYGDFTDIGVTSDCMAYNC